MYSNPKYIRLHLVSESDTLSGKRQVLEAVTVIIERINRKVRVVVFKLDYMVYLRLPITGPALPTNLGRGDSSVM